MALASVKGKAGMSRCLAAAVCMPGSRFTQAAQGAGSRFSSERLGLTWGSSGTWEVGLLSESQGQVAGDSPNSLRSRGTPYRLLSTSTQLVPQGQ